MKTTSNIEEARERAKLRNITIIKT